MKCTGACGAMSWKASMSSSSYTLRQAISPRTILQNTQSFTMAIALPFRARILLVDAGAALAPLELREHGGERDAVPAEHHQAMEPEVGGLVHDRPGVFALRRDHRLGRFLAHLPEDRVEPLRVERRHVRRRGIGAAARGDRRLEALEDAPVSHGRSAPRAAGR